MGLIDSFLQGGDVFSKTSELRDLGEIDEDFASALIQAEVSKDAVSPEDSGEIYTRLAQRVMNLEVDGNNNLTRKSRKEAKKIVLDALNAVSKGRLSKQSLGEIVNLQRGLLQSSLEPTTNWLKIGFEGILNWYDFFLPGTPLNDKYDAIRGYIVNIGKDPSSPEQTKDKVLDDTVADKYKGYSRADLEFTAKKYGMSIDDVVKMLEAQR